MKDINLIPPKYLQEKINKQKKRSKVTVAVALIAVLVLGSGVLFKVRYDLQRVKSGWDAKSQGTASYAEAGKELDYIRSLCTQRQKTADNLNKQGIDIPAVMRHIEQNSTPNLLVNSMTISEGNQNQLIIIVNGFLPVERDINALVYRLEKDTYFDSVKVTSAKRVDASAGNAKMFNFIISLTINLESDNSLNQ